MSNNVTVKWISEETRVIPRYGVAKKGEYLILPRDKAESLINQKLATEYKPVAKKKEVK